MSHIVRNTALACAGLSALLLAGCNGGRTYSLGSTGEFRVAEAQGIPGPQGEQGPSGPQGPAGPSGLNGLDAVNQLTSGLGSVTIGDNTLIGGGSGSGSGASGPLGVSVLAPTQNQGEVATVGVLSGGAIATVALGQPNTPTTTASGPADSLLGLNIGGNQVIGQGSSAPAIDLAILSPSGASGTAVTGNILSNGQPVSATITGVTGSASGEDGLLGGVTSTVGAVVQTVTTPSSGDGGLLGGVTTTVGNVVQGVTGVLPTAPLTSPTQPSAPASGGLLGGLVGALHP